MRHFGALIKVAVYLVGWFIGRNLVDGRGALIEVSAHVFVALAALLTGYGSFRATLARREA